MKRLIKLLSICVISVLASGCQTTKDGRSNLFRSAATASGNPFAQIAVDSIYGTGGVQDYRLPDGLGISAHPVDADGNWIEGVVGYAWFLYPLDGEAMPTFSPAAFMPMGVSVPVPSRGTPVPLRPATPPEPRRPQYDDLIDEAVNATRGKLGQ